jgi:hypothetical protein
MSTQVEEERRRSSGIDFHGGCEVYSKSGVDLTLLDSRLKLSVTERWERNFQALALVEAFREAGRAKRAERCQASGRTSS